LLHNPNPKIKTKKKHKPQLKIYSIIHDAQNGDAIIVSELSRLGRSMLEIMEILSIISEKERLRNQLYKLASVVSYLLAINF
jgi:predicted DNA binding protein